MKQTIEAFGHFADRFVSSKKETNAKKPALSEAYKKAFDEAKKHGTPIYVPGRNPGETVETIVVCYENANSFFIADWNVTLDEHSQTRTVELLMSDAECDQPERLEVSFTIPLHENLPVINDSIIFAGPSINHGGKTVPLPLERSVSFLSRFLKAHFDKYRTAEVLEEHELVARMDHKEEV